MRTHKADTNNIIQGISWSVTMRWSLKFLGLINVAILARLLTPEDYGIVAIATLTYGIITLFVDFGVGMLVMRTPSVTDELLNAAWTAKIIQGALLALSLLLLTPLFVNYFHSPILSEVMWLYALASFISGFGNIGVILFRKNLEYKKDFRFVVVGKVGSIIVTIILAFWLKNFWALVYGQLASSVLGLFLSYVMHNYRPKLCFGGLKKFLLFSVSLVFVNIGKYISQNISLLVGGRILATEAMGLLSVAVNFASIFTQELMLPVARAMFPQYARMKDDPEMLKKSYLSVLSVLALALLPIGFGVSIVAHELIAIILGAKWLAIDSLVSWLAIAGVFRAITWILSGNILIVTNNEKKSALFSFLQVLILVPAVVFAGTNWGVIAMVQATVIASCITLPIAVFVLKSSINSSASEIFLCFFKPTIAATIMYAIVYVVNWGEHNVVLLLIGKVCLGGVIYMSVILLPLLLPGRQRGIESEILDVLITRIKIVSKSKK